MPHLESVKALLTSGICSGDSAVLFNLIEF